jgi:aminoglycoside phosphotransferase (APT) family kinase protein/predicted metal-dependent phosphoesterase TrpH
VILEMHSHTAEHSPCSHVSADDIVRWVVEKGLQGIVITDHHYLWQAGELSDLAKRAGVPRRFLVLAGQETEVPHFGHVLIYGADETIPRGTTVENIRSRWPDAAVAWAHPYRDGARPADDDLMSPLIDAVEIFSSNHSVDEAYRGLLDWHRLRFTAIAGTDTHARSYGGEYPTIFDHPVRTIEELAAELRAGRCRPFFKEIPRSGSTGTQVTEITFGTKGGDEQRERLVVKEHSGPRSRERGERTFRVMEALARHGFARGPYRAPEPLGTEPSRHAYIERGIRGRTLFEVLKEGDPESARAALTGAARWLARLHNLRLAVTSPEEFFVDERDRLEHYVSGLDSSGHPHRARVREVKNRVLAEEIARFEGHDERLVQGHGDFHPKNILVGQDRSGDRTSEFIAAIDLASSYRMPRAFDVGTFLAQFRNQLFHDERARAKVPYSLFLETYIAEADGLGPDFAAEVELYKARAGLSILYYLNKVGMGSTEDFWRVLVDSEHSLDALAVHEG